MLFKRCTIGGQDFEHKPTIASKPASMASLNLIATPGGGRTIEVNSILADRLNSSIESQMMSDATILTQDFFINMAVCNTVIVAKKPHRDEMNASGIVVPNANATPNVEDVNDTKPPVVTPLKPDPNLAPKRPQKLPFYNNPLSPIASSPENSPPTSPILTRPKKLEIPGLLTKFLSNRDLSTSIAKSSRSPTPTPLASRPLYEAESPDELALVDAAFAYNCKLQQRNPTKVVISLPVDGISEFEVMHVLPFDSNRKRMSIMLFNHATQERILYCKGADSAMIPKLVQTSPNSSEEVILNKTISNLSDYAKKGLRTLVMAKRVISKRDYEEWQKQHENAENSMWKRDKLLEESYDLIESHMELLGASGIEDKLQDRVPSVISNLRLAGIVVWVLTGDKQETAINIAYSCQLFSSDSEKIFLNAKSRDEAESLINQHLKTVKDANRRHYALVLDSKTTTYCLDENANLLDKFLDLAKSCGSVLGCRLTPLQKAMIVKKIKVRLILPFSYASLIIYKRILFHFFRNVSTLLQWPSATEQMTLA